MSAADPTEAATYLQGLQDRLCSRLGELESDASFTSDHWDRPEGGGGVTRVLADGEVFERVGVGFADVSGEDLPPSATAARPHLAGERYRALGVSIISHPRNPYVPSAHANVRLFVIGDGAAEDSWWFGGGFDLTPYYGFEEDARHWHGCARKVCAPFGDGVYERYKRWCDEYFRLPHRDEARGIGGLFFDDLNDWDFDRCLDFVRAVGDGFLTAYRPIVERRRGHEYGERERAFQLYRRGRYVEFNLLYDRGTLFGLRSGGRTESILMSMPPLVAWRYGFEPEPDSPEARLVSDFLKPRDW